MAPQPGASGWSLRPAPKGMDQAPLQALVTSDGAHSIILLRSEEHTSELQSHVNLVCRLLLEKKKNTSCINTRRILIELYHDELPGIGVGHEADGRDPVVLPAVLGCDVGILLGRWRLFDRRYD